MRLRNHLWLAATVTFSSLAAPSDTGTRLDARFMDAMALQRGQPVLVTGSADPDAALNGNVIEIDTPPSDGALIRYCWGDTPVCNLMAPDGTPVTPFELALD